jgi:hypothetical protein
VFSSDFTSILLVDSILFFLFFLAEESLRLVTAVLFSFFGFWLLFRFWSSAISRLYCSSFVALSSLLLCVRLLDASLKTRNTILFDCGGVAEFRRVEEEF